LQNINSDIDAQIDKANNRTILIISAVILLAAFHLASWGSYSLEIRYLQLRDWTGTASAKSMDRMAKICFDLKYYNCAEYAYSREAQIDKNQISKFAEFQMSRHKFKEAAQALRNHLKTAKRDTAAMLTYARALGELGQIDEAARYYEHVIGTQARTLQPEVVKAYVKDLAKAKRYTQAQAVILRARKTHARAAHFMEQEYRLLEAGNTGPRTAAQ
jgi:hypothetical protein